MTYIHPVTDLMNDHRRIEAVMTALEGKLKDQSSFPAEFVGRALAFFVEYADAFHHHKEEEQLFPALAAQGMPINGGPIAVMLQEHTLGRKLLAGVRANLEKAGQGHDEARAAVRGYALQYIELLRQHIWKEDNILFAMAQRTLDDSTARQLAGRFAEGCTSQVSAESVERHKQFAAAQSA